MNGIKTLGKEINQIAGGVRLGAPQEGELIDLEKYQEERNKIITEYNKKVADLQSQIDDLNVKIVDIEKEIPSWQSQINNLQKQILDTSSKITNWEGRLPLIENARNTIAYPHEYLHIVQPQLAICQDILAGTEFADLRIKETGFRLFYGYLYTIECVVDGEVIGIGELVSRIRDKIVGLRSEVTSLQSQLSSSQAQLSAAKSSLEANTRHMHDLQLAKDSVAYEKLDALSRWQIEYESAKDRKRIEIDSITRDLSLGYPQIDAETARNIAEMAYSEALERGFTRLSDAMSIATEEAEKWSVEPVFPHFTTETVTCPSCGATLELTVSDIEAHNRDLTCPKCGASVGRGIGVRVVLIPEPVPPVLPVALKWYEKYGSYLALGAVGTSLVAVVLAVKKRKKVNY